MNNLIKAKLIVELLDERKYSILSSFSSSELSKLNSVNLDELNQLSAADINTTLNEFLTQTEQKIQESQATDNIKTPEIEEEAPKKKSSRRSKKEPISSSISEKLSQQPVQLIACLLNKVDDKQKKLILDNLSKEQKNQIEATQVDENPIFDTVVDTILSELELTSA